MRLPARLPRRRFGGGTSVEAATPGYRYGPDSSPPPPSAPVNTVAPAVTGTAQVGQTLSSTAGTWTGTAPISYAYQWQRRPSGGSWADISGATASTYTLVAGDLDADIRCVVTASNAGGSASANSNAVGPVTSSVPLTEFRSDGWSATYAGTPPGTTINEEFTATYQGFTTSGASTTWNITNRINRRVRVPGSTALDSTNRVSLARPIYAGTTCAGVVNNVTSRQAPQPVVNWAMLDRLLVGNSEVRLAVTAFHGWARAAGQVALVRFSLSDGTTTLTRDVSTMTVFADSLTSARVVGYETTFPAADVATLANGVLTANVEVFPWVGVSSSVFSSATAGLPAALCSPRHFVKDTTRFAAIPRCYIDPSAGNDTTGVWSTVDATASSLPFLTMAGALASGKVSAIPAGAYLAAGDVDGCEIRIRSGGVATGWAGSGTTNQKCAAVIVTRDPAVARADAVLNMGAAWNSRLGNFASGVPHGAIVVRDISFNLTAGVNHGNVTVSSSLQFDECNVSLGGFDTGLVGTSIQRVDMRRCNLSNGGNLIAAPFPGGLIYANQSADWNGKSMKMLNVIGSILERFGGWVNSASAAITNHTIAFNRFMRINLATSSWYSQDTSTSVSSIAIVQNVFEAVNVNAQPMMRVSGDSAASSTFHVLEHYNTYTGFNGVGRHNKKYVDSSSPTSSRDRTHAEIWNVGNVFSQLNTKHDLLPPADALRIGGWEWTFGCGMGVNVSSFQDAGGGSFRPDYLPPGFVFHTSNTTRLPGLNFADYRGTVDASTSGAGNGDYRPTSGSVLIGIVPERLLPVDLAGNARPAANDTAGAYTPV